MLCEPNKQYSLRPKLSDDVLSASKQEETSPLIIARTQQDQHVLQAKKEGFDYCEYYFDFDKTNC